MPRRGSHKVKYFSNKSLNENMIDKCGGFLKWGIHLNQPFYWVFQHLHGAKTQKISRALIHSTGWFNDMLKWSKLVITGHKYVSTWALFDGSFLISYVAVQLQEFSHPSQLGNYSKEKKDRTVKPQISSDKLFSHIWGVYITIDNGW